MTIIEDTKAQQLTVIDLTLTSSHILLYLENLVLIPTHPLIFLNSKIAKVELQI
jgi:hypothetical protein